MSHFAFQEQLVVADLPFRVESICTDGAQLLIGGANGTLLVFRVDGATTTTSMAQPVLVETRKQFTRRGIDQLCIVKELDMLVVLSDATVSLFDSRTWLLRSTLGRTRGATCFAVHRCIEISQLPEPPPPSDEAHVDAGTSVSATTASIAAVPGRGHAAASNASISSSLESISSPPTTPRSAIPNSLPTTAPTALSSPVITKSRVVELGMPQMVTKLAVAVRKKLFIFKWIDTDYVETRELRIPDRVRSLAWLSGDQLCLGLNKEYMLLDIATGQTRDIFSTVGAVTSARPTTASSVASANSPSMASPQLSRTLVTRLPVGDEVLVSKENTSMFVGVDGRPTRSYGVVWTAPPENIAYSFPFLIGTVALADHAVVEIRNITTQSLVQQLELEQAHLAVNTANGRGYVYIASDRTVWRLVSVSFQRQVDQLVAQSQFDSAIALLNQIESLQSEEKTLKLRWIQFRQALHLFYAEKQFDTAMSLLSELRADPAEVIACLFPSLVTDSMKRIFSFPATNATTAPSSNPPVQKTGNDLMFTATSTPSTSDDDTTASLLQTWSSVMSSSGRSWQQLSQDDLNIAVGALVHFLTDTRSQLVRQKFKQQQQLHIGSQQHQQTSSHSLASSRSASATFLTPTSTVTDAPVVAVEASSAARRLKGLSIDDVELSLVLVDTMLLKAYLLTNEALVGPLLRVANRCDVDEAERLLTKQKKWSELLDLFFGKAMHRKALLLLTKHFKSTNHPIGGTGPLIKYLRRLGAQHFELVLEFSSVLLQHDPSEGLKVFMDEHQHQHQNETGPQSKMPAAPLAGTNGLPCDRVVAHLEKTSPQSVTAYLEYIIWESGDRSPDFHNKLALWYLEQVMAVKEGSEDGVALQKKLLHFLEQSKCYRADRLLPRFPLNSLFRERAVLLARMGQHEQVLAVYVRKLHDYGRAEEYCDEVWERTVAAGANGQESLEGQGGDIYQTLVRIYLEPVATGGGTTSDTVALLDAAFSLLSRAGDRLAPSKVLPLMPAETQLARLLPYLEKYADHQSARQSQLRLVQSVLRTQQQQLNGKCVVLRRRRLVVDEYTTCAVCMKRLGSYSAIVSLSGGNHGRRLVHYGCRPADVLR